MGYSCPIDPQFQLSIQLGTSTIGMPGQYLVDGLIRTSWRYEIILLSSYRGIRDASHVNDLVLHSSSAGRSDGQEPKIGL